MIDKSNIKVGDEVYYVPSWHRKPRPIKETVEKIGRKYITLSGGLQFDMKTMREKTHSSTSLYMTEKGYYDELKAKENSIKIRRMIDSYEYKLTLDQTLRIMAIFEESKQGGME